MYVDSAAKGEVVALRVAFDPPSIESGALAELVISDLAVEGGAQVGVQLAEVMAHETEWKASWGQEVVGPAAEIRIAVTDRVDLGVGLYGLASLSIRLPDTQRTLTETDFGLQLLEVREVGTDTHTHDEVVTRFGKLMESREAEFMAGFGLPEGTGGANEYGVLIFVKNCKLTKHMRLGQYEVIPFGGLAVSDEVDLIQEYLKAQTTESMPAEIAERLAEKGKSEQPSFVAHFPLVRAESVADAATRADAEVRVLCGVLSLTRRAYPSPFAALVLDLKTKVWNPWVNTRNYTGNMFGGLVAGEDAETFRKYAGRARSDERLALYLNLYRSALEDVEPEFKYFRLWSLLEVMAAQRVTKAEWRKKGDPLLDWAGNPAPKASGKGLRHDVRYNGEMVYEYLRQTISSWNVDFNYASQVQQSDWRQLADIWYQHRNCMAHAGGCFPHDPSLCDPNVPKQAGCRAARDETVQAGIDHYLSILADTASHCLSSELA